MPSYLDLGLIGVILVSALLAMLRGFTREVLAIVSWGAAAIAALYLHPLVMPYLKPYISKDSVALAAAIGAVFFVTLVIVSLITVRVSDAILDSRVGALDRSIGFGFWRGQGPAALAGSRSCSSTGSCRRRRSPKWVKTARHAPAACDHRRPRSCPSCRTIPILSCRG